MLKIFSEWRMTCVKGEGVPVQINTILRERLQDIDKNDAIELYFELLSSGHSVGEILGALNSVQSKAAHDDTATAECPRAEPDGAPTSIAAETASVQEIQAMARRIPELSNAHAADDGRTDDDGRAEQAQAVESTQLKERGSDKGEQLPSNQCGSEPDILAPAGSRTSANCEATRRPGDQERIRPGKLPGIARSIAFRTLYAAAVASALVVGFSILPILRDTQLPSAHVLSSLSGGIATAPIPRAEASRAETVENTTGLKEHAVDADILPAPEPLRSAEPDPAVPGPAQRGAAEVRAVSATRQPQAREPDGSEAGQPNPPLILAAAATVSNPSMPNDAPPAAPMQAAPTQSAEAANGAEPAPPHAADPASAAMPATATTHIVNPAPEARDIASAADLGAEHRIEGDHSEMQAAGASETARAGQPHPGPSPTPEASAPAPAPAPGVAETAPEKARFKTAEADALVTRGDEFFAAGDLASARLLYEYAATAGNGVAALRLGGTFDPGFLARAQIGRVQGDPAIALYWYRRARDLGNGNAEILLKRMEKPAR